MIFLNRRRNGQQQTINKLFEQRERNRIVEPKGVLITTEYGEATGNLRETWQTNILN